MYSILQVQSVCYNNSGTKVDQQIAHLPSAVLPEIVGALIFCIMHYQKFGGKFLKSLPTLPHGTQHTDVEANFCMRIKP